MTSGREGRGGEGEGRGGEGRGGEGRRIHRSTTENFCWDEIRPRD